MTRDLEIVISRRPLVVLGGDKVQPFPDFFHHRDRCTQITQPAGSKSSHRNPFCSPGRMPVITAVRKYSESGPLSVTAKKAVTSSFDIARISDFSRRGISRCAIGLASRMPHATAQSSAIERTE